MTAPALGNAYAAALYRIDCGDESVERRIGVVDALADAALARAGCVGHWHVLTAFNPGSVVLTPTENARRHRQLSRVVARAAWRRLAAVNLAADGSWQERGICLLDVIPDHVRELAARFGQLAFVGGEIAAAPALVWTAAECWQGRKGRA